MATEPKSPARKRAPPRKKSESDATVVVKGGAAPETSEAGSERLAEPSADVQSREEQIRLRAYRLFLERGHSGGDETRDWLDAEAELDRDDADDRT